MPPDMLMFSHTHAQCHPISQEARKSRRRFHVALTQNVDQKVQLFLQLRVVKAALVLLLSLHILLADGTTLAELHFMAASARRDVVHALPLQQVAVLLGTLGTPVTVAQLPDGQLLAGKLHPHALQRLLVCLVMV